MSNKIQFGVAGMILIAAIAWRFLSGKEPKQSAEIVPLIAKDESGLEPDQVEKNKIMSELGKKGAAKSAAIRKAKAAKKKAEKDALLNEHVPS